MTAIGERRTIGGIGAHRRAAGASLAIAGGAMLMGIITAEALYPAVYRTSVDEISDLGSTRPPDSIILQPSAAIFDATMVVGGLLVVVAAWSLWRARRRPAVAIPVGLLGVGLVGVGVFPGDTGTIHALFALLTFVAGGVAAIASSAVSTAPVRYLSALLGTIALVALVLALMGDSSPIAALGDGGMERWVAYPLLLWATIFGGYLMGAAADDADPVTPPR